MMVRGLLIAVSLSVWAGAAFADPKDDVLNAMAKCADMHKKTARLDCFDQAAPALRAIVAPPAAMKAAPAAIAAPPAPSAMAAPALSSSQAPAEPAATAEADQAEQKKSWFGFGRGKKKGPQTTPAEFGSETVANSKPADGSAPPKEIDEIEAHVVDYATNALGKTIVFLDNGQIWRQMDSDSAELRFKKAASDNVVVISRGALGSYSMIVNHHGALAKVQRTK